MKHKVFSLILSFFVLILSVQQSYAQKNAKITTNLSSGFIHLTSYNGVTNQAFNFQVAISPNNVNIPNWALMVRLKEPIRNREGKVFDPSKISIRINRITGDGPTIQQLGINNAPIPLSLTTIPIVSSSAWPLSTGPNQYHRQFVISFDIIIAGGSYLEALKTYSQYKLNLDFLILNTRGDVLSEDGKFVEIQAYPTDVPPIDPVYSLKINPDVSNGLLEFKSIGDYVNGVSRTYTNGLSVISSTPYALQVKTQTSAFESSTSSIPVNTVSLNLKDPNSSLGGTVALSDNTQTIINNASNNGTQERFFNIHYFTAPNDVRLQNAKPATYQATLLYTLIPQ